jgi:hypothetical protein
MKAATIGLDIAKQVFQVHAADRSGKAVFRRKLRRSEVEMLELPTMAQPARPTSSELDGGRAIQGR